MNKRGGTVGRILCAMLWVLGAVLLFAAGFVVFLTVTEYRPAAVEQIEVAQQGDKSLTPGQSITVFSFNTGYASLDKTADFFMDGGDGVKPTSGEIVNNNLEGIMQITAQNPADIYLLQEADRNSDRSYRTDQIKYYTEATGLYGAYAVNYKCAFVPYPVPFIGKVESGLLTLTDYTVAQARRVSLPVPFSWPVRIANLKRCMLAEYFDIAGSEAKLVVINVHLEAYDDGTGKRAQTEALLELATAEYAKGNYVLIGGDFNQTFPGAVYPVTDEDLWMPGTLSNAELPEGWQFAFDADTPTCRLLNEPYEGCENPQYYVIDGFVLSPNLKAESVETLDCGFEYSDHNPVKITVVMQ